MGDRRNWEAYFEMAKPRITALLLVVALMSYALAAGSGANWWGYFQVLFSVGLLGTGIFALNHWFERKRDALMVRTRDRPVPSGRVSPLGAQLFGWGFTLAGLAFSFLACNPLTGFLALFTALSYLAVYTPLKYYTSFHTALGAFPGAVPPLAGWAIATGELSATSWILFAVLFLWQFPHFLSIELIYKDDYAKADVKVLPVVDRSGKWVSFQILAGTILLLGVSLVPWYSGLGTWWTGALVGASALGFFWFGLRAVRIPAKRTAKHLLRASVLYLPVVFVVLFFHP